MQKVYLLLRDNKQSGPYSLDEILQLGLRPFDLVWVEGRSSGWAYPSEINALKPYVPEAPASVLPKGTESTPSTPPTYTPADVATSSSPKMTAPPKSVFISMPCKGVQAAVPKKEVPSNEGPPTGDWDRRVEEVRQRAQSYTPPIEMEDDSPLLNTNYARSLDEVEEEYTSWVYNHKKKKTPVVSGKGVAALVVGVLLMGGGYLVATSGNEDKKETVPLVSVQPDTTDEEPPMESGAVNEPIVSREPAQPQGTIATTGTRKEASKVLKPLTTGAVTRQSSPKPSIPGQSPVAQQPVADPAAETEPAEEEAVVVAPTEKKKTLADKIDGFIEKIASKGPGRAQKEEVEEAPRTGPAPGSGERRATRRGEKEASAPNTAELARQVDVVANNSDNWMMGVKDLKITVRNYNAVPIRSVTIEVSYYSESDDLLEKKTVKVSNIPAKGRKIVGAPDQRLADHVELKVVSVAADEEAYAQQ